MEITVERRIHSRRIAFRDLHIQEWVLGGFNSCVRHKPYALLLHGWMGQGTDFVGMSTKLAENGLHVIVPDLPYHGMSIRSQPENILKLAQELIPILHFLIRPAFHNNIPLAIIGYSLGGRIALELCSLLAQHRTPFVDLRAIILISCAPAPSTASERALCVCSSQSYANALLSSKSTAEYNTWLRTTWYQNSMWGKLSQISDFDSFVASRVQAFSISQRDAWATAAICFSRALMTPAGPFSSQTKALYICGSCDTKYLNLLPHFQSLFPNFNSFVVPQTGHNVLLEAPKIVIKQIVSFLSTFFTSPIDEINFSLERVLSREYTLRLREPISVNGQNVSTREGILVSLLTSRGAAGVGDICPLPGLQATSITSCRSQIDRFRIRLNERNKHCALCFDLININQLTEGFSAVVRNGIECGLIHAVSETIGMKMNAVLRKLLSTTVDENDDIFNSCSHNESVSINTVVPRKTLVSKELFKDSVTELTLTPSRTVKLKVGVASSTIEEAQVVTNLARACKQASKGLRLDANRSWSTIDYNIFCEKLEELGAPFGDIEYIEEPLQNASLLQSFLRSSKKHHCNLRVALDETLTDCTVGDIELVELAKSCEAFIVKPAVVGSLQKLKKLVGIANDTKCVVILSSAFESGVGIAWNAFLASVANFLVKANSETLESKCHGLGTYSYLLQDVGYSHFASDCLQADKSAVCLRQCYQFLTKAALFVLDTYS